MSDYTKITDFSTKDALPDGDPEKVVSGTEIDAELDAIAVAVASKPDEADVNVLIDDAIEDAVLDGIGVSSVAALDSDITATAVNAPATAATLATVTLPVSAAGDCYRISTYARVNGDTLSTGSLEFSATVGGTAFSGPSGVTGPSWDAGGHVVAGNALLKTELFIYVVSTSSQKVMFLGAGTAGIASAEALPTNHALYGTMSKDMTVTNDVVIKVTNLDAFDLEHVLTIVEKITA